MYNRNYHNSYVRKTSICHLKKMKVIPCEVYDKCAEFSHLLLIFILTAVFTTIKAPFDNQNKNKFHALQKA